MTPRCRLTLGAAAASVALSLSTLTGDAQYAVRRTVDGRPDATIDLRTSEGTALVKGQWRYADARITPIDFRGPGADLKPSGAPVRAYDLAPRAGAVDFDDRGWDAVDARDLEARRGTGKLSYGWYRINVEIPARVGAFATVGSTAVFEIVVDDYAEIWVDGSLPRPLGQSGGGLIKGFNAPNRVALTRSARPGQRFQIAVFAANGPLSDPPPNFIWVRSAALDFYRSDTSTAITPLEVQRADPALDAIVPPGATIEKLAGGFLFTEGPVWVPDGYLLFSDPNNNTIYRWSDADGLSVFRTKSGYSGPDIGEYGQPGSNGLALDPRGRLTISEHGNRRVTRLEKNGVVTVLADRYRGKRLNSPNDLVYRADGSLYFTDPPFGLPKVFDDPRKELDVNGIYRWSGGEIQLLETSLKGPNGIAFPPDQTRLFVGNWDEARKVVMRYRVRPDGSLSDGRVFADLTAIPGEEAIDGVKVDVLGNVYVSGPGGLRIFSDDGKPLGVINGPEHAHNFAFGDTDGRTLYITARTGLYRTRLGVPGFAPAADGNGTSAINGR